jgi:hypothetical protein
MPPENRRVEITGPAQLDIVMQNAIDHHHLFYLPNPEPL